MHIIILENNNINDSTRYYARHELGSIYKNSYVGYLIFFFISIRGLIFISSLLNVFIMLNFKILYLSKKIHIEIFLIL